MLWRLTRGLWSKTWPPPLSSSSPVHQASAVHSSESQLLYLPRVPKGLHKLILEKPQAKGQALSSLGLCGQLTRPQPPQLERPCRAMLTFRLCVLADPAPTLTSSLSGHKTLARHRSSSIL